MKTPPNPGELSPHSGEIAVAHLRGYRANPLPRIVVEVHVGLATTLPSCLHAVHLPEPPLILVENGGGQTTDSSGEKQRTQTRPQCHILLVLGSLFWDEPSYIPPGALSWCDQARQSRRLVDSTRALLLISQGDVPGYINGFDSLASWVARLVLPSATPSQH